MGPRRYRRGNPEQVARRRARLASFNGATTLPSRKSALGCCASPVSTALQWGHDVTVAEILVLFSIWCANRAASMGPRRYRRGNLPDRGAGADGRYASMGPRRYRRGNLLNDEDVLPSATALQWGHDVTVAEI